MTSTPTPPPASPPDPQDWIMKHGVTSTDPKPYVQSTDPLGVTHIFTSDEAARAAAGTPTLVPDPDLPSPEA